MASTAKGKKGQTQARQQSSPRDHTEPSAAELLSYYKQRIDEFEAERQNFLDRVDLCAAQKHEQHKLEWESKRRADEVKELQKALSDAHTYLFEERERLLKLQSDNDELRLQEVEDRKRIQHLLAMHSPLEQEITYNRDGKPSSVTVWPRRGQEKVSGRGQENVFPRRGQENIQKRANQQDASERVMRTVYLPAANADNLMLRIESLQAQLNEQKQFASERVAALLEDRRVRGQDEETHRAAYEHKIDELTQRLKKTELALQRTTKDYILAKRDKQEAEGRAAHASKELQQHQQQSHTQVQELQLSSRQQLQEAKDTSEDKMESYCNSFRSQLKRRDEDFAGLQSVHAAVKGQLERQAADLTAKLMKSQEQVKQLEVRRALDAEGWLSDVTILRKQLQAVDRKLHQMRLIDRLQDDERLDALLKDLARRAPDVLSSIGDDSCSITSGSVTTNASGNSSTSQAAADLSKIKVAISGMQQMLLNQQTRSSKKR